jgi:hypothetical protein
VTPAEVKAYLHIDFTDDDDVLANMIKSARQALEEKRGICLVETAVQMVVETTMASDRIQLAYGIPETVAVVDEDEEALVADDDYKHRSNILSLSNYGLHTISYTVVPEVNEAMKEAIMLEVKERYETKDSNSPASNGVSEAALSKIQPSSWL